MNKTHETAEKYLKIVLWLLVLWDLGLAIYAILFAKHFEALVRFPPQPEPLFIRGVGVYWLFAAWFQFLGARNPRKFVTAVQLAIVFRLSAAVIDSAEILFLLPRPWYFFHSLLTFFVFANLVIAYVEAKLLGRMGLRWFDIAKGDPTSYPAQASSSAPSNADTASATPGIPRGFDQGALATSDRG